MKKYFFIITVIIVLSISFIALTSCSPQYEYAEKKAVFDEPDFQINEASTTALSLTKDGQNFLFSKNNAKQADKFVNAQLKLAHYLGGYGISLEDITYYVSDYQQNFSLSDKESAYISENSIESYKQVLTTLQALWGDYVNYGYLYAVANEIAEELKWETEDVEVEDLDEYFAQNSYAANLTYLCFSPVYSTAEQIYYCKALSKKLFNEMGLLVISKPIQEQESIFCNLADNYAKILDSNFKRLNILSAYNGKNQPVKVSTRYFDIYFDENFEDYYAYYQEWCFADCETLLNTLYTMDQEISKALVRFDLEGSMPSVSFYLLSSETATEFYFNPRINFANLYQKTVVLTCFTYYLHEYYHHILYEINPTIGSQNTWQQQAFCELGRRESLYASYDFDIFANDEKWAKLFTDMTGEIFNFEDKDIYLVCEITCYLFDEYSLDYKGGGASITALLYYLLNNYGEDTTWQLLTSPNEVQSITGKQWSEIEEEWKINLQEKYKGFEIPDWIYTN